MTNTLMPASFTPRWGLAFPCAWFFSLAATWVNASDTSTSPAGPTKLANSAPCAWKSPWKRSNTSAWRAATSCFSACRTAAPALSGTRTSRCRILSWTFILQQIITDFHPAMIATSHPDERHVDHRTSNWFVVKACQELLRDKQIDPQTIILADQVYGAGGAHPAPYKYEKFAVNLSGETAVVKEEMSWIYQSQDGNLAEGARKTFSELPKEEIHYRIVDWQEHAGWNE